MNSQELNNFLNDVGNSVHSMNTIAVALSVLPNAKITPPKELNISWEPNDILQSKKRARNFAERSAFVYSGEGLFEYLDKISMNPLWNYPEINFKGEEKKADKVFNFLNKIEGVNKTMAILCELLSHWRNRIVHHSTSKASLSSNAIDHLLERRDFIYENFHHFDIELALSNYKKQKVTLKDVSTLITIAIKSARLVDKKFFLGIKDKLQDDDVKQDLLENKDLNKIFKQSHSQKRSRQINHWIKINYPYLDEKDQLKLVEGITTASP